MPAAFSLRYTLCFLQFGEDVLMLHRKNPPNQGLWNGVGGHIEPGETPLNSALREVWEETGCRLSAVHFAGILTWSGYETPPGGLYITTARVTAAQLPLALRQLNGGSLPTPEGDLAWHPRQWVCSNSLVVSNIHIFAPHVLYGDPPRWYHFEYQNGAILSHQISPLPDWEQVKNL